jgi:hypothetical protein
MLRREGGVKVVPRSRLQFNKREVDMAILAWVLLSVIFLAISFLIYNCIPTSHTKRDHMWVSHCLVSVTSALAITALGWWVYTTGGEVALINLMSYAQMPA